MSGTYRVGDSFDGGVVNWGSANWKDLVVVGRSPSARTGILVGLAGQIAVDDQVEVFLLDAQGNLAASYDAVTSRLAGTFTGTKMVTALIEELAESGKETFVILEGVSHLLGSGDPWLILALLGELAGNQNVHLLVSTGQPQEITNLIRERAARILVDGDARSDTSYSQRVLGKRPVPASPFPAGSPEAVLREGARTVWFQP